VHVEEVAVARRKVSKGRTPRASSRKRAPAAVPATAAGPGAAVADLDGHSEFELKNEAVETALQTGEHAGLLEDYFGPEQYAELRR
jgi:hypothetical protein